MSYNDGAAQLEIASDLSRHQRAVNVVRWSPSGEFLASGDDESAIFIWKLKNENEPINILGKLHCNVFLSTLAQSEILFFHLKR